MFTGSEVWAPTAFTPPLSDNPTSDGYRLIKLVEKYWLNPDGSRVVLDEWQKQLLIAVLETYPNGKLRYRQVVISLGRQNGKSLIAAILSLYALIQHTRGPLVIGVASTREQAQIVYDRTHYVIKNVPRLNKIIKPTGTRGLRFRDGSGSYQMRASKGEALQGLPVTLGICDELHILDAEVWDALVNGQRAQTNGILIGITTAGDDESFLLKRLYDQGKEALGDPESRFGFFLWEAPEGSTIDTPGALEAANPAIACGRIDVETVRSDVRALPEVDQKRYALNSWIPAVSGWLPGATWSACGTGGIPEGASDLVWSVDRSQGQEWASIALSAKHEGRLYTQLVASIPKPNVDQLTTILVDLTSRHGGAVALDSYQLKPLANEMKSRGIECWPLSAVEMTNAASTIYAKIMRQELSHNNDALLSAQVPLGKRKNVGEAWRISRADSSAQIDSLMATVIGVYVAEIKPTKTIQLL